MSASVDKQKILKGMWWVKGNEHKKFTGILTYGGDYVPTLEIFLKDFDFRKQSVPDNCIIYGDVFGESKKIQAVTLLGCTSQNRSGNFTVGAYIYKQEFIRVDCVAIGMLLNDDEIAQVQSPQNIYLTCPGLDEYSFAQAIEYVWKDNIPEGRAYRISDLERIEFNHPEPIAIEIDIGTITISLVTSSGGRDLSSRYSIHISLEKPTQEAEVNSLIYVQLLTFLSIMTGRREYIERHSITINSDQTRYALNLELNYGHIAHSTQETEYSMLETLLRGSEENMRKFATLFPKWRENFTSVEDLAFHYLWMVGQPNEINILQAFPYIETYVLKRLLNKNKKGMPGILSEVIHSIADHFSCSSVYSKYFPADRIHLIANQLANYRNKRIHPKSDKEYDFTFNKVYAYIEVILRSIFLKEMEYSYDDIDNEINHWSLWRQIGRD